MRYTTDPGADTSAQDYLADQGDNGAAKELKRILQVYRGWTSDKVALEELPAAVASLQHLIEQREASVAKAFGGCTKCYGKGYSTTWSGISGARDFDNPGFVTAPKTHLNYCTCERGQQLKALSTEEAA